MRPPGQLASTISLGLFITVAAMGLAQRGAPSSTTSPGTASDATARIVAAAQALLITLDPKLLSGIIL